MNLVISLAENRLLPDGAVSASAMPTHCKNQFSLLSPGVRVAGVITFFLLMFWGMPVLAAPTEIATVIHANAPYGKGSYGAIVITAYDAELWTDAAKWSMEAPFALTLRYHMAFSTEDFVDRGLNEMKRVDPALDETAPKRFSDAMTRVFPPVKDGDTITALFQPGEPVKIFHNGSLAGEIADKDFAEPFFGIWLSPETSAPLLRAHLLRLE